MLYSNCTTCYNTVDTKRSDSMIKLDYKSSLSLHEQIANNIKNLIFNGAYPEHSQLPSVREMSVDITVNPNTVQKAYKLLENDGYIYSVKGKGNFVAPVSKDENTETKKNLYADLEKTIKELAYLKESKKSIFESIDKIYKEMEE
ncbi:MAG: GntR family transcriptional regulator [Ruminococcaceae bacterium]|nr:GntR family transcriptional regulator [Oscillospiraceae bacterium]